MRNSRFTIGMVGFLAFVFCVDTAISDAQIFRRRLCNPCWQQQCDPCRQQCWPNPCDYSVAPPNPCGSCTVQYVVDHWEEIRSCNYPFVCCCDIPVVVGDGRFDIKSVNCARLSTASITPESFLLTIGTGSTSQPKKTFFFHADLAETVVNMEPLKIYVEKVPASGSILHTSKYWTVMVKYDRTHTWSPQATPYLPVPEDPDTISIEHASGTLTTNVIDDPTYNKQTVQFGKYILEFERSY